MILSPAVSRLVRVTKYKSNRCCPQKVVGLFHMIWCFPQYFLLKSARKVERRQRMAIQKIQFLLTLDWAAITKCFQMYSRHLFEYNYSDMDIILEYLIIYWNNIIYKKLCSFRFQNNYFKESANWSFNSKVSYLEKMASLVFFFLL